MCWFHTEKALEKRLGSMRKPTKDELLGDIGKLQLSSNPKVFDEASKLLLLKWMTREPILMDYFEKEWLVAFNRVLKDVYTFRDRTPLAKFLPLSLQMVDKWSLLYDSEHKIFETSPPITLELWTKSFQWVRQKKQVKEKNSYFLIPAGEALKIEKPSADIVEWKDFLKSFDTWKIVFPKGDTSNWMKWSCTCPAFLKNYICKHVLGVALRKKYITEDCVPSEAKCIPIGHKRKRGRPKLARHALIVDVCSFNTMKILLFLTFETYL